MKKWRMIMRVNRDCWRTWKRKLKSSNDLSRTFRAFGLALGPRIFLFSSPLFSLLILIYLPTPSLPLLSFFKFIYIYKIYYRSNQTSKIYIYNSLSRSIIDRLWYCFVILDNFLLKELLCIEKKTIYKI